jgi:uncharacterized protein YgbK (DUF1537 family)
MTYDVVVADDLTGASDTVVQFLPCSERAIVFPSLKGFERAVRDGEIPDGSVAIGVNTESRHLPPSEAARRVLRAHRAALRLGPRLLFQKVDSAMRGNPGAELAAYRCATASRNVVMTPAFLPSRRTVKDGVLFVNGVPLSQSEVAADLRTPMDDSSVAMILRRQTDVWISHLSVAALCGSKIAAQNAIERAPDGIIVADAECQEHLELVARLVLSTKLEHSVSGSAGLAGSLSRLLPPIPPAARQAVASRCLATLVIFGSPHPVAVAQLHSAAACFGAIERQPDVLGMPRGIAALANQLAVDLAAIGIAMLTAPGFLANERLDPSAVAAALSRVAVHMVKRGLADALVVSGGDVAAAVCKALGVDWIELKEQLYPGAPLGLITGGIGNGLTLVTKSGAHGDEQGITTILTALRDAPASVGEH